MHIFINLFFLIFSLLNPTIGSSIYIIFLILFETYITFVQINKIKVKNIDSKYTHAEIEIIERYHVFFQYPIVSRFFSSVLSGIQLSTFILTPWFLLKGLWIQGILVGINYFIASQLAVILNPQHFLHDNIEKNRIKDQELKERFKRDMEILDSALKKMYLNKT